MNVYDYVGLIIETQVRCSALNNYVFEEHRMPVVKTK